MLSEQVGATGLGKHIDDGLDGLRALQARHEDRVRGQGHRDVGHPNESDERAILTHGSVDGGTLRVDADGLTEAARGGSNTGQRLKVAQVRPAERRQRERRPLPRRQQRVQRWRDRWRS